MRRISSGSFCCRKRIVAYSLINGRASPVGSILPWFLRACSEVKGATCAGKEPTCMVERNVCLQEQELPHSNRRQILNKITGIKHIPLYLKISPTHALIIGDACSSPRFQFFSSLSDHPIRDLGHSSMPFSNIFMTKGSLYYIGISPGFHRYHGTVTFNCLRLNHQLYSNYAHLIQSHNNQRQ